MTVDPHRLAELRSLAYHKVVAERLDEGVRARARAFIAREFAKGTRSEDYLRRWQALLSGPDDELRRALTSDDEASRALRSATPFAGALTPKERWALWRKVREAAA